MTPVEWLKEHDAELFVKRRSITDARVMCQRAVGREVSVKEFCEARKNCQYFAINDCTPSLDTDLDSDGWDRLRLLAKQAKRHFAGAATTLEEVTAYLCVNKKRVSPVLLSGLSRRFRFWEQQ